MFVRTKITLSCWNLIFLITLPKQAGRQRSLIKKDIIVNTLCRDSVIDKVRSCLEQFKDGLQTLNILDLITKHPGAFEDVFCYNKVDDLTSKVLDDLFYPCLLEMGTVKREKEEQIVMHWQNYLADCEGMCRQVYETGPRLLHNF